jgi:hypothetical protein
MQKTLAKSNYILLALVALFFSLFISCSVQAQPLLGLSTADALKYDFVSFFGFQEKSSEMNNAMRCHIYVSDTYAAHLVLGEDPKTGKVVYLQLDLPRVWLDDAKLAMRGRDLLRSFVMAIPGQKDLAAVKELADEIYVRGLDLVPVQITEKQSADTGKPIPREQAYKVTNVQAPHGEYLVFLSSIPILPKEPSYLYQIAMGKMDTQGVMYEDCLVEFSNYEIGKGDKHHKVLLCKAYDRAYWQAHKSECEK